MGYRKIKIFFYSLQLLEIIISFSEYNEVSIKQSTVLSGYIREVTCKECNYI